MAAGLQLQHRVFMSHRCCADSLRTGSRIFDAFYGFRVLSIVLGFRGRERICYWPRTHWHAYLLSALLLGI